MTMKDDDHNKTKNGFVLCPCMNVRRTCAALLDEDNDFATATADAGAAPADGPRQVRINDDALHRLALQIVNHQQQQQQQQQEHIGDDADDDANKKSNQSLLTSWDEHEWHYTGRNYGLNHHHHNEQTPPTTTADDNDNRSSNSKPNNNDNLCERQEQQQKQQLLLEQQQRRERVALYILALDAINFCFWPLPTTTTTLTFTSVDKEGGAANVDEDDENICTSSSTSSSNNTNSNWIEYEHLATTLKYMAEQDDCYDSNNNNSYYDDDGNHDQQLDSNVHHHHPTLPPPPTTTMGTVGVSIPQTVVATTVSSPNYAFSPHQLANITVDEMTRKLQDAWNALSANNAAEEAAAAPSADATTSTTTTTTTTTKPKAFLLHNMKERCRLWNELGNVLLTYFHGSATLFIQQGLVAHPCHYHHSSSTLATTQLPTSTTACDTTITSSTTAAATGSGLDGFSSCSLVQHLIQYCSGFRDEAVDEHNGRWICFYKRAQICVADLHGALDLTTFVMQQQAQQHVDDEEDDHGRHSSNDNNATTNNSIVRTHEKNNMIVLDALTTFADYRVPQYLRHVQVLEYCPSLADWIDQGRELIGYRHCHDVDTNRTDDTLTNTTNGRMQELYIRAATVVVAQRLVEECRREVKASKVDSASTAAESNPFGHNYHLNDVLVDWYLWQLGEGMLSQMKPHHRVRTIYY